MTTALRLALARRDAPPAPLLAIQAYVREHGMPDAAAVRFLAEQLRLPEAAVRAAVTFYADLSQPVGPRACCGTSCELVRSAATEDGAEDSGVYCLGYCYCSPASLTAAGEVVLADGHDPAALPDIRCATDEPIVTRRLRRGRFADLESARSDGAYETLCRAVEGDPAAIIDTVEQSGEQGRGGAGYPTAVKWRACAAAPGHTRYVVANGDEGDPGSFIDRLLMEHDPHSVLEGLALCARAVGANEGIVYIRSEYPAALRVMQRAIDEAVAAGVLGDSVCGTEFALHVSVFPGMGSYVCGEETAMLNAMEGFRGEVRLRPPYPAVEGLFGCPTVVNNVETLANIPWIVERGAGAYRALGTDASPGTKALCLNTGFAQPGVVEAEFGVPLRTVVDEYAGGGRDGDPLRAVLVGGPMGSVIAPEHWDIPVCYHAMRERGFELGHGGLVAVGEQVDADHLLRHTLGFMQHESCGKCVPCRLGSQRALDLLSSPMSETTARLSRLLEVMGDGSLCAFGRELPRAVRQLIDVLRPSVLGGTHRV